MFISFPVSSLSSYVVTEAHTTDALGSSTECTLFSGFTDKGEEVGSGKQNRH